MHNQWLEYILLFELLIINLKSLLLILERILYFSKNIEYYFKIIKMGKISYFKIILHKQNPIYYSGETIEGQIKVGIIERLKCNSISMTVIGRARTHWY